MVDSGHLRHRRDDGTVISPIHLDHIAVAMEDRRDGRRRYAAELGGEWVGGGADPGFWSEQVRYANGMKVEILEPLDIEQNDFLRRFLDRNGPGPHHLTFKVKDIVAALAEVEAAGYRPVGVNIDNPGWREAFLHPKDAPGVVVQLAQSDESGDWGVPLPDDYPTVDGPMATLERVTHAVASLDDALGLFRDVLAGEELGRDADEAGRWVDLAWHGPGSEGRIRLVEPTTATSPLATWIGDRPGRVHHLAFALDGAGPRHEVSPEDNLGVRLVVHGDDT
jgi:catechol 2,3-dioxygenase-like lactoylglutathione lyase family enzyme